MKELELVGRNGPVGVTTVDDDDYVLLSSFAWRTDSGYALTGSGKNRLFMHRAVLWPPNGFVVDHIDGNKLNNTRQNLRVCRPHENSRNRRKSRIGSSGYHGVTHYKANGLKKWGAELYYRSEEGHRVHKHFGFFKTRKEAHMAYVNGSRCVFGEYSPYHREKRPSEKAS